MLTLLKRSLISKTEILVESRLCLIRYLAQKPGLVSRNTKNFKRYGPYLVVPALCFCSLRESEGNKLFGVPYFNFNGTIRLLRSLKIGALLSFDYWYSLKNLEDGSKDYEKAIKQCHSRAAERILEGCLLNGGLYVKLGQGLIQMNHILPREYLEKLEVLYDKALERGPEELEKLFQEDFGKSPEELFHSFNKSPIAAASLAQVYEATTHEGEKVAVKVQYIDLQKRFNGDCDTVHFILRCIRFMHPSFNFVWLMDHLRSSLSKELDFINEAVNMEQCQTDLSHLGFVRVPKVHWNITTKRVLTQEFINGVKVNDVKGIKELGLKINEVDEKLVKTFATQIFITGRVHADPHPGNVFICKDAKGEAQIVLLDHGLYEDLPEMTRSALSQLWKAIVLDKRDAMKYFSFQLGVKDYYFFSEMLMQRPLNRKHGFRHLSNNLSSLDSKYMIEVAQNHFDRITETLKTLPLPMLLIIRNINTVRAIIKEHGNVVDRYSIMAYVAANGVLQDRKQSGILKILVGCFEKSYFSWSLRLSNWWFWWNVNFLRFLGWIGKLPNSAQLIDNML